MARRHQWRKYNIDYDRVYGEKREVYNGVPVEIYANNFINFEQEKYYFHTNYKINNNGTFQLTDEKDYYNIPSGAKIYASFSRSKYVKGFTSSEFDTREFRMSYDNGRPHIKLIEANISGSGYKGVIHPSRPNIVTLTLKSKTPKQGSYVGLVQGQEGEFPDGGQQGDFWYVYDKALNEAPTISGSSTRLGTVRSDFDIRYTVYDADGDRVKVQVMVDDRVIQYPMDTTLGIEQKVRLRLDDYSLGEHTITVTATDSSNASATRTYYFTKSNQAPTISGSDLDLGGVFKDVSVDYIVQDADGDSVEVKISLDEAIKQPFTQTTLGVRRTFNLPIKSVELGRHKLEIEARDSQGASSVRTYTFEKVNSAPVISGSDVNLGAKNTAFSYKYSIMDNESDNVKVVEKLNGSIIKTLYNVTLGQEQIITISDEQIREMELHKQNTIEIEASDGTATVYRRINFTRNNMPPIISDQDKDLGILTDKLEYKFSATDPEDDTMVYTVSLDDRILVDREPIPDGREKSILIEGMDWLKIRATKHTIKIFVEDDKGFKSTRTITFTRRVDRIIVQLAKKGIVTDEIANRVLISDAGMYSAKGAITKIEVCNNSFDDKPKWEDATIMFKAGKAYNFQNKEKTASQAGVNVRVTIEKGESTAPSYITATGGSFD